MVERAGARTDGLKPGVFKIERHNQARRIAGKGIGITDSSVINSTGQSLTSCTRDKYRNSAAAFETLDVDEDGGVLDESLLISLLGCHGIPDEGS